MDDRKFSCGAFIDLKKSFDTVNHEILLAKFKNYGIKGVTNSWFRLCLRDRKQTITACLRLRRPCETCSKSSFLGPLIFLLYSNDTYKCPSLVACYLFAGPITIIFANNNLAKLQSLVNHEPANVNEW